jgi:hypothetical protein
MLKPLLLPQLVEERRKRESSVLDSSRNNSQSSMHDSSMSDVLSVPATPTFSTKGHARMSSSISSMDMSMSSPRLDSPNSPTFSAVKNGKRALPDVAEEPLEREEEFDMFGEVHDAYDWSCKLMSRWRGSERIANKRQGGRNNCSHYESTEQNSLPLSSAPDYSYDLSDGFVSDGPIDGTSSPKKRRTAETPLSLLANRISTRFPTLARKWRSRKSSNPPLPPLDLHNESPLPVGSSSRSSSLSGPAHQTTQQQMPPTPDRSDFAGHEEPLRYSFDENDEQREDSAEERQKLATTPLLPPMMMAGVNNDDIPIQSPLQSPSVADPMSEPGTNFNSGINTPIAGALTPSLRGMPSPPLSTKPSVSSIRRVTPLHHVALSSMSASVSASAAASTVHLPAPLLPAPALAPSDIPSFPPTTAPTHEDDRWASLLGHANFTISPAPYLPTTFDVQSCRQLKAEWEKARAEYMKHLVRTGEHYGVTSRTYALTEEKWSEIEKEWRANNEVCVNRTAELGMSGDAFSTLKLHTLGEARTPNGVVTHINTNMPDLTQAVAEGKFPERGDEDIVGPMERGVAKADELSSPSSPTISGLKRASSKKEMLRRFFVEKFPAGFGRRDAS